MNRVHVTLLELEHQLALSSESSDLVDIRYNLRRQLSSPKSISILGPEPSLL
jgi:hypothetical protein